MANSNKVTNMVIYVTLCNNSLSHKFPNLILNFHLEKRKTETFEANKVLFETSLMTYDLKYNLPKK